MYWLVRSAIAASRTVLLRPSIYSIGWIATKRMPEAIIECSRERLEAGAVLVSEMAAQQYDRAVNRERFWLRAVADEAPETQLLQGAEIETVLNRVA